MAIKEILSKIDRVVTPLWQKALSDIFWGLRSDGLQYTLVAKGPKHNILWPSVCGHTVLVPPSFFPSGCYL